MRFTNSVFCLSDIDIDFVTVIIMIIIIIMPTLIVVIVVIDEEEQKGLGFHSLFEDQQNRKTATSTIVF